MSDQSGRTTDLCQKPGCSMAAEDTYRDEHGNELRLCADHYYKLVSGDKRGFDIGIEPTLPFDPIRAQEQEFSRGREQ